MSIKKHPLSNYYDILAGKKRPGFQLCAEVGLEVELDKPEDELWLAHDDAMDVLNRGDTSEGPVSLLDVKAELARRLLSPCRLCERRCKVDRKAGETGFCKVGESRIASRFVHLGEEPDLIPSYTVFFSGCTFECLFCQNWDISQRRAGTTMVPDVLAKELDTRLGLVKNINWVGGEPTPNLPYITQVLLSMKTPIPQIWNSNMFMTEEAMKILDGLVDVYLADFKWGPGDCSRKLSRVHDYWDVVRRNHLKASTHAEIVLRHLVMPGHVECCTKPLLEWVADNLDKRRLIVNVMDQYRPEYKANDIPDINRRIKESEYLMAVGIANRVGLELT